MAAPLEKVDQIHTEAGLVRGWIQASVEKLTALGKTQDVPELSWVGLILETVTHAADRIDQLAKDWRQANDVMPIGVGMIMRGQLHQTMNADLAVMRKAKEVVGEVMTDFGLL